MHLHECHGELSRLYGRLDSEDLRNELDPMDIALMDSIARTVQLQGEGGQQVPLCAKTVLLDNTVTPC